MPTYPLNWPSNKALTAKRIEFSPKNIVAAFPSTFTGQTQVLKYSGQWWELNVTMPIMAQADAEEFTAFLTALGGMAGSFYFRVPPKFLIGANQNITVAANGNDFTGGSGVQVGKYGTDNQRRLVQFTTATSVFPASMPGSNTITAAAYPLFRLSTNDNRWSVDEFMMAETTVAIREAI